MSSNLVEPDDRFRKYFKEYRAANSVNTIPYDKNLPHKDARETPLGQFNSKKVTVVGMGQVGLGCVSAILNQEYVVLFFLHVFVCFSALCCLAFKYTHVTYTPLNHLLFHFLKPMWLFGNDRYCYTEARRRS